MKVSTKIGSSFFLLSAFVLIGGIAGYYGIHRLSQSLDFVTQDAWNAADGAMEAVIGIQDQMIALEHIISRTETLNEQEETLSQTLLEHGKSMMTPAIERMMASGLMSSQAVATLNEHLPAFSEKQAALLIAYEHYRDAHIQLDENRLQFFQAITAAETFVYHTADTLDNKLETLELKRTAIDGIREIHTLLLERSFYFEEWSVGEQEQQNLRALDLTLNKLENQVEQLIRHPFFRTALDNPKTDAQTLQLLLQQHKTDFSKTIKYFRQFKAAQVAYSEITEALLKILAEIEELGDSKVEGETQAITQLKYSSKLIIIIVIVIALLSALIASWIIVRAITIPLEQTKEHLKMLARGQIINATLNYKGNDEIAEIVSSTRQLKFSVQTIIDQASAIAAGDYSNDIQLLSEDDRLGQALLSMTQTLRGVIAQTQAIAAGDYSKKVQILSDRDQLGRALMEMTTTLQSVTEQNTRQDWLKTGQTQLSEHTSGEQDISHLTKNIISFLSHYLNAEVGLLYLLKTDNPPCLHLVASYGYSRSDTMPTEFLLGEGLVGQAALDRHLITRSHRPEETIAVIQSSLAQVNPPHVIWSPFLYENAVAGVIELGLATPLSEMQQELLQQLMPNIGIAINTARSRDKMQQLLQQSQKQAEQLQQQTAELTAQQEQMQQVNEELQSQAEELQSQQEELRQTNDELEIRTRDLEQQREAVRIKNQDLEKTQAEMERARVAIEQKAQELELASKYKSEFLANMSHELRTPLNSLLILAQLLAENKAGNLTEKQQEYARTIHSAGADLLTLINEILDLSKVEAGKMDVYPETVRLQHLLDTIEPKFRHLAEEKQLTFEIEFQQPLPESLYTDPQRLKQIINNLLSNAFKFTTEGYVKLILRRATTEDDLSLLKLTVDNTLVISVIDSGVGIAKDKQQLIFEAFQQEDGTTSRRYGGTGLGLSISRQLARLLGGELQLHSELGQGSTFTLYLPQTLAGGVAKTTDSEVVIPKMPAETPLPNPAPIQEVPPQKQKEIIDDREHLGPDDKCLLIIEDDRKFMHILMELTREKGFKCLIAEDGKTGLQLAETYKPQAIILDISLPKVDGWTVMEKLKDNHDLRHIPVHFMSAGEHSLEARKMGAIGYLLKPVNMEQLGQAFKKIEQFTDRTVRKLLVLTDNAEHQQQIFELVGGDDIQATLVATQTEAYEQLQKNDFDCVIVDVEAEASTGVQFLQKLHQQDSQIPIILHAARGLTVEEEHFIHRYTDTLTVKAVQSPERLLDEATLFLHQIEAKMPQKKREMLQMIHDKTALLMNKRVLVVDDDIRNTFALTTVLEDKDMEVFVANNGQEALTFLQQHPDMDIVLMDIMMPEMDGYEATKKIRAQAQFRKLPIIALTAKAMKGDKAKCIEAGANDYLSKPVDTDKLVSLMRVWLYR